MGHNKRASKFRPLRSFSGFTLGELIVVVTILAILATIGLLSLSGYRDDAKEAVVKTNVRSVYTAISAESAISGTSPRYYVVHDQNFALSWSAIVVFDGTPVMLAWGKWNEPGTNYSAGNPDYAKLKLDREKFKIASVRTPVAALLESLSANGADPDYFIVGTAAVSSASGSATRSRMATQVAWVLPSGSATVAGDFPTTLPGSVAGLIKDAADPSSSGALVDGAKTGGPPPCEAADLSGYAVPYLSSGESVQVMRNVDHGTVSAEASCSFGNLSLGDETASCASGFVPSGLSCVADICSGTEPGTWVPNASSNATSQSVSGTWHRSEVPGQCTFDCDAGHSWDGSACRSDCEIPVSLTYSGLSYALDSLGTIVHGSGTQRSGIHYFGNAPANGSLAASFSLTCDDGEILSEPAPWASNCQTHYQWNGSRSSPVCELDGFAFSHVISSNANNFQLKNAAIAAGWNQTDPLYATVTVNTGIVLGSANTSSFAFDTGTGFPVGSELTVVNYGHIVGAGGRGGDGNQGWSGNLSCVGCVYPTAGGGALKTALATNVENFGTIGGGGWGWAGGGGLYNGYGYAGWGGGGWAGSTPGSWGNSGYLWGNSANKMGSTPGSAGTLTAGWPTGANSNGGGMPGAGGWLGSSGGNCVGYIGSLHGSCWTLGGAAGASITGIANVTFIAEGTVLGPRN